MLGADLKATSPSTAAKDQSGRAVALAERLASLGLEQVARIECSPVDAAIALQSDPGLLVVFIPTSLDSDAEALAPSLQDEIAVERTGNSWFRRSEDGKLDESELEFVCQADLDVRCCVSPDVNNRFSALAFDYYPSIGLPLINAYDQNKFHSDLVVQSRERSGGWHFDRLFEPSEDAMELLFPVSDCEGAELCLDSGFNREIYEDGLQSYNDGGLMGLSYFMLEVDVPDEFTFSAPRGFVTAFRGSRNGLLHRTPVGEPAVWRVALSFTQYL